MFTYASFRRLFLILSLSFTLPSMVAADTLRKLSEVKRGKISELSVAGLDFGRSGLFVTAVRDDDGNLRVMTWANTESSPRATEVAGAIERVSVAALSDKRFVTAVRDSADKLRVIAWQSSADGRSITRLGTAVGPRIRDVEIARGHGGDLVFVSARLWGANLLAGYFEVTGNSITPKDHETYFDVDAVSVSSGTTNAIAMREDDGDLRLMHFWTPLFRGGDGHGGKVAAVSVANDNDGFAGEWFTFTAAAGTTGVRSGSGCRHRRIIGHGLGKIIGWELENTSIQADFVRTGERDLKDFGGIAKAVGALWLDSTAKRRLITAHLGFGNYCRLRARDQGKPRLQLTAWSINRDEYDNRFEKEADALLGGDYTDIAITRIKASGGQARFAVVLRGVRGELKVTVWGLE